jgi:hypothetical protein
MSYRTAPALRLADSELARRATATELSEGPHKCSVFGRTPPRRKRLTCSLGCPTERRSLRSLAARSAPLLLWLVRVKVRVVLGALNHPLRQQHQFLLLRESLVPRLVHVTRTGPVNPEGGDADTAVKTAFPDILQAAWVTSVNLSVQYSRISIQDGYLYR